MSDAVQDVPMQNGAIFVRTNNAFFKISYIGTCRTFLIKFDDVEDLVSASECVGSDDNIAYDCVNYYCELPSTLALLTCSCKARGCVLAVC